MTTEAAGRRSRPSAVLRAVRRALEVTFVEPVSDGRPILSRWPSGLGVVGWITIGLVVVLTLVAAFSGVLRAHLGFVASQSTNRSIPELLVPLFIVVVVWTLGLAHCAVIRLAWYIKLPALVVVLIAMGTVGLFSSGRPAVIAAALVCYLPVIVLVLVRRRAPYAWWEFPLVTTFIALTWTILVVAPSIGTEVPVDLRFFATEQTLESVSALAYPALVAAGVAPALVTVTAAEAIASRPLPRVVAIVGVLLVVAWRVATSVTTLTGDPVEQGPQALLAAAMTLAVTALFLMLVWWLSPRRVVARPGDLPEAWTVWSFAVAVALVGVVVLLVPIITVYFVWTTLGLPGASVVGTLYQGIGLVTGTWWRAVPGAVMGIGAILLARRNRVVVASLLATVCVVTVTGALGTVLPPGMFRARTVEAMASITSWLAIVVLVVLLVARRLTRHRMVGLMTVLLVGGLYTYRGALDDPVSALVGFAGLGTVLFGLVWQGITGAGFTRSDTRRFPMPTRVFAYLANTLFAFTVVAFVAATRADLSSLSLSDLDSTGDAALGTPLLLAATVLGLWYGFGTPEPPDESLPPLGHAD